MLKQLGCLTWLIECQAVDILCNIGHLVSFKLVERLTQTLCALLDWRVEAARTPQLHDGDLRYLHWDTVER